jgi:hypothetical protein
MKLHRPIIRLRRITAQRITQKPNIPLPQHPSSPQLALQMPRPMHETTETVIATILKDFSVKHHPMLHRVAPPTQDLQIRQLRLIPVLPVKTMVALQPLPPTTPLTPRPLTPLPLQHLTPKLTRQKFPVFALSNRHRSIAYHT